MFNRIKELGPGVLIAAAFIGPGTVTMCTIAGASYGYTLLWAMVLSIIATLLLQEMAARLGIISGRDLSFLVRTQISSKTLKAISIFLILSAVVVGNAAYEAGNISGGSIGLAGVLPDRWRWPGQNFNYLSVVTGIIAFILLFSGKYKIIEKGLITLVVMMALSFAITAVMVKPDIVSVLKGLFIPVVPESNFTIVLGLIGTTVVPYNLFLHSSLVQERWKLEKDLKTAQLDSFISIVLGGIISLAIIITASAIENPEITSAAGLAKGLEPLYGRHATFFMAIGMFAAGISSAITAPFAAAYVVKGCLGWDTTLKSARFRAVWISILLIGTVFSALSIRPIELIIFAQVANGVLLPIITGFLIWMTSKKSILGEYQNSIFQISLAVLVLIITVFLGIRSILVILGNN